MKESKGCADSQKGVVTEHTICVNGRRLNETRQIAVALDGMGNPDTTTITVTRTIDKCSCRLVQVKKGSKVIRTFMRTTYPQDKQDLFEKKWNELWNPMIDDDALAEGLNCNCGRSSPFPDNEKLPYNKDPCHQTSISGPPNTCPPQGNLSPCPQPSCSQPCCPQQSYPQQSCPQQSCPQQDFHRQCCPRPICCSTPGIPSRFPGVGHGRFQPNPNSCSPCDLPCNPCPPPTTPQCPVPPRKPCATGLPPPPGPSLCNQLPNSCDPLGHQSLVLPSTQPCRPQQPPLPPYTNTCTEPYCPPRKSQIGLPPTFPEAIFSSNLPSPQLKVAEPKPNLESGSRISPPVLDSEYQRDHGIVIRNAFKI